MVMSSKLRPKGIQGNQNSNHIILPRHVTSYHQYKKMSFLFNAGNYLEWKHC